MSDKVVQNIEVFISDFKQMRDNINIAIDYFEVIADTIQNPIAAKRLLAELGDITTKLNKLMSANTIAFSKEK